MKKVRLILGLMLVGLGAGCLENSSSTPGTAATILYRHHFLGAAHLAHNTNDAKIPAILALPATHELSEEILQKLSRKPDELWRKFLGANASTSPALVRPLLEDLASAESYAEVRGPLDRSESVLAIELSEERANLWRANLGNILTAWKLGKPSPLSLGAAQGWEVKRAESPMLIQLVRAGQWVLVGAGQERLTLLPGLLEQVNKSGRPLVLQPNVPLEFEADFPRLNDWLPGLAPYKLPPVHLTLTGKGDYLRTEVTLSYSDPLPLTLEPWRFPTNIIKDPIVSFTVARGIAPLLSQVKGFSTLGLKPLPNQFCAWGPATVHADTFLTIPVANPSNALYQIGPKLPEFTTELLSQSIGGFTLISNRNELLWQGWPVLLPHLRAIREDGADYLLGGLFPMPRSTNPPPPELFSQLKDKPKLVYYDWEFTPERLVHAEQFQQLWDMVNNRKFPPTNAPTQKWLKAIAPQLANTITEGTLSAPKEVTIVRKSDFGLTGIELATLARWVESAGFPWSFEPAKAPSRPKPKTSGSKTNVPLAKSPALKR